ncbi:MAG: PD40 domain-containing protein [Cyclobacteriaceae bacterium]|nr:PD40 domain-containing protein [Cyclobacteriaceae bacterium]
MKKTLVIVLSLWSISALAQQENLVRFPAINPTGSLIAFSFQGDIWTVPASGGRASRLTIHEAYEMMPVFSPDGKSIAFSGARYGNNDIFVIPTEGGIAKRLTYHSSADNISSWSNAGNILFSTSREFQQIERPLEVYAIAPTGGTESRILDAVGFDPMYSPDGRFLAFTRGDINPIFREDYRGSSNRDIWLFDTKIKSFTKITAFDANDILPRWGDNRTLYFLSTNSGRNNLYKLTLDENGKPVGAPEQLTNYNDHSIRYFSISLDGKTIVLERDKAIYLMNTNSKSIQKVAIQMGADARFDPVVNKTATSEVNEYDVSPNGKLLALGLRGEAYVKEANKEKSSTENISNNPFREMNVTWMNDSIALFTSDREDNNFEIYMVKSADSQQSNIFKSLKHQVIRVTKSSQDESSLVVSGDGKKLAYVRGRGTLVVCDISPDGKITNEKILLDGWASPEGIKWSPDNSWLAYTLEDLYFNEEVFIHAADNSSKPVNVSMHPRYDGQPCWSADGSKLGFISARNNRNNDAWFIWLKKEDWEKSRQDWEDAADDKPDKPADKDKKDEKKKPLKIDFENIHERVVQVTSFSGNEGNLIIAKDGETFFYTAESSTAKGRDLYSIKWNGKDLKELTKSGSNPSSVLMDREGKYLYYLKTGGSLSRIDIKGEKTETLPYVVKQQIDYTAERNQIFEEAWRTIRDGFYDPQFHGKDWNALRTKYKELCVMASTNEDFRDMFNYLLGELNSSHMALTTPVQAETQKDATGMLGAELVPVKEGMKVIRVIPNSPVDKVASKLVVNDVITAIDSQPVSLSENFYNTLNMKVDDRLLLTVSGADGKSREVAVRPVSSVRQLMYEEWVKDRKKLVDKFSNGKLGYIHIQAMSMPSFEVFERELQAAGYGKEGLVVDVRYNGGGSTTDYLMAVLNYKQHAYTIPRGASDNPEREKTKFRDYYPTGERLIYSPWMKPSIALCNEGSYSNAEIFSHAYKTLGIGKLVGVPTNGSVISTGGRPLVDGSFVRLPFRGWYTKATDKNQELGPAVPDILVNNPPDWIANGTDEQLKVAVEELLKQISTKR